MVRYDVLVIGGGPAGERAAIQAAKLGKQAALIEREHVVGGTGVNWGAVPSKTLRESALFVCSLTKRKLDGIRCSISGDISIAELMYRERMVVQRELALINEALERHAVNLVEGHGSLVDEHTVRVVGADGKARTQLHGDYLVIATGTRPNHPADIIFDHEVVFDSATILGLPRMPRSIIVLGAGVVGVEYACIFGALGLQVTLVDTRTQLLPYVDREICNILERELRKLGVLVTHDDHYARVERVSGVQPSVRVHTRQGNVHEADVLLYCVGRDGNTEDLGLSNVALAANSRGLLDVNEHFQTAVPHIYAVGDVIGYPALASTSMDQGRQAVRHAFDAPGPRSDTSRLPFAIYGVPEVAFIGDSEEALRGRSCDYVVGRGRYERNPRGQIIADTGGLLKLLFERQTMTLLGVHIVGTAASELVHTGQVFLQCRATAGQIAEMLYNYPTLSDLYRHAAVDALVQAGAGSDRPLVLAK